MKTLFITIIAFAISFTMHSQDTLKLSDFEGLNKTSWKGKLTYKDYRSGNQETIDATMQIKIKGKKVVSTIQYTYEPNKNDIYSAKLKNNGTYLGNEKVISNRLENGIRTIVTTYKGRDNGKKAIFYTTHLFSKNSYNITKEVTFENSHERFIRNTYEYTKL